MKKLLLALLLFPAVAYTSEQQQQMLERLKKDVEETKTMLKNPEYLKFILGNRLDMHLYGALTPGLAQDEAQRIHTNLVSEIGESKKGFFRQTVVQRKNHFEAGRSLPKSPDAVIVNTCATIEQNLRNTRGEWSSGKAGMISGIDPFLIDNPAVRFVHFFTGSTCKFDGTRFFKNACPCDFYKKLTDEQLEELRKGTQEASK